MRRLGSKRERRLRLDDVALPHEDGALAEGFVKYDWRLSLSACLLCSRPVALALCCVWELRSSSWLDLIDYLIDYN